MTYGLSSTFSTIPGKRDELLEYLLRAADMIDGDPTCLLYLVATTANDDEVSVTEAWIDEAAHDASLNDPRAAELMTRAMPCIAGLAHQIRLDIRGGKGLGS